MDDPDPSRVGVTSFSGLSSPSSGVKAAKNTAKSGCGTTALSLSSVTSTDRKSMLARWLRCSAVAASQAAGRSRTNVTARATRVCWQRGVG